MRALELFERSDFHFFIGDMTNVILDNIINHLNRYAKDAEQYKNEFNNDIQMAFDLTHADYNIRGIQIPEEIQQKWEKNVSYDKVMDTIKNLKIILSGEPVKANGEYDRDRQAIIIYKNAFGDDIDTSYDSIETLVPLIKRTLSHELTHLYQDVLSNGNAFFTKHRSQKITNKKLIDELEANKIESNRYNKETKQMEPTYVAYVNGDSYKKDRDGSWYKSISPKPKNRTKGGSKYWSSKHEVDARFSHAIHVAMPEIIKELKSKKRSTKSIYNDFKKAVMNEIFFNDSKIPKKISTHYEKRLAKVYSDLINKVKTNEIV